MGIQSPFDKSFIFCGELAGIRTQDPRLKRALLYQLSYELSPLFDVASTVQVYLRVAGTASGLPCGLQPPVPGREGGGVRKLVDSGSRSVLTIHRVPFDKRALVSRLVLSSRDTKVIPFSGDMITSRSPLPASHRKWIVSPQHHATKVLVRRLYKCY